MNSRREFLGAAAVLGTLGSGGQLDTDNDDVSDQTASAGDDVESLSPRIGYDIIYEHDGDTSFVVRDVKWYAPGGPKWEVELEIGAGWQHFHIVLDREAAVSLNEGLEGVEGRWFVDGVAEAGWNSDYEDCQIGVTALGWEHGEEIEFTTEHGRFNLSLREEERNQVQRQLRAAIQKPSTPDR